MAPFNIPHRTSVSRPV